MADGPVLFWSIEPRYGCSQPVRAGDLMCVKDYGLGWKEEGKVVMVLQVIDVAFTCFDPDQPEDLFLPNEPEECVVIIDGRREDMRIEYLEPITD